MNNSMINNLISYPIINNLSRNEHRPSFYYYLTYKNVNGLIREKPLIVSGVKYTMQDPQDPLHYVRFVGYRLFSTALVLEKLKYV